MLQIHIPDVLRPESYDRYLASGWFRGSGMLYKSEMLCMDGKLHSVVNIRLPLRPFTLSKSQRRMMRVFDSRFRCVVGKGEITVEKEELYTRHCDKFSGFIHPTLQDMALVWPQQQVFETWELSVFDGERLVACSFFDRTKNSVAGLLSVFDREYSTYSLGICTMLREIELANQSGCSWYYPGYVMDLPSSFDYKRRLDGLEFLDESGRWHPIQSFDPNLTAAKVIRDAADEAEKWLNDEHIPFRRRLYPMFIHGCHHPTSGLVSSPIFQELEYEKDGPTLILIQDVLERRNRLLEVVPVELKNQTGILRSKDYLLNDTYYTGLLEIVSEKDLEKGLPTIRQNMVPGTPARQLELQ